MYRPKTGGYRWRSIVAGAQSDLRNQRQLLAQIIQGDISSAELWQLVSAAVLLNAAIAERLNTLQTDFDEEQSCRTK